MVLNDKMREFEEATINNLGRFTEQEIWKLSSQFYEKLESMNAEIVRINYGLKSTSQFGERMLTE